METFSQALKKELKFAGKRMLDLAKELGVSHSYLSIIVRNKIRKSLPVVEDLSKCLMGWGVDTERVLLAYFLERDCLPIHWLKNPEAKRRLAAFAVRLWIEEREIELEKERKNVLHGERNDGDGGAVQGHVPTKDQLRR